AAAALVLPANENGTDTFASHYRYCRDAADTDAARDAIAAEWRARAQLHRVSVFDFVEDDVACARIVAGACGSASAVAQETSRRKSATWKPARRDDECCSGNRERHPSREVIRRGELRGEALPRSERSLRQQH